MPSDILTKHNTDRDSAKSVEFPTENRLCIIEKARENILKAKKKQKEIYDRKHATPNSYCIGDMVLKKDFRRKKRAGGKLDARYTGPYIITKIATKGQYSLRRVDDPAQVILKVNGGHLKPYKAKMNSKNDSDSLSPKISFQHSKG